MRAKRIVEYLASRAASAAKARSTWRRSPTTLPAAAADEGRKPSRWCATTAR